MLKKYGVYIAILLVLFSGVIYLEVVKPKELDWTTYFTKNADTPYGGFLLFENMEALFPNKKVETVGTEIRYVLNPNRINRSVKNYVFLSEVFDPDTLDSQQLINWVTQGNNAFIIANELDGFLADQLKISTFDPFESDDYYYDEFDAAMFESYGSLQSAMLNFTEDGLAVDTPYYYKRNLTNYYFSSTGSGRVKVLGFDEFENPNFIRIELGEGFIYLHCLPRAFSNYFVSDPVNHEYAFKALSYLPIEDTYWDEFYKLDRGPSGSPLRYVMRQPPLKWALILLLSTLLIFTLFHARRRQRVIPVVAPLKNTTLEFVNIIGTLYYNKGSHKIMAEKKIMYFLEHVRANYQIKTLEFNDDFMRRISVRSGLPKEQVKGLFKYIDFVHGKESVEAEDLLKLNKLIEDFINFSQR